MKVNILNPSRNSFEIKATELPSRGVLYPDLVFRLKPYTVGDILAISSSTLTTQGKISTILAGIETLKPFDLENLVSIDLDALALLRFTISSDTPVYSYIVKCPKCQNEFQVKVPAEEIIIEEVPVKEIFEVNEMKFFLPTIKQVLELETLSENEFFLGVVASYCINYSLRDAMKKLQSLSLGEFQKLKTYIESQSNAGVQDIEATCKHCNYKFKFTPDLLAIPF